MHARAWLIYIGHELKLGSSLWRVSKSWLGSAHQEKILVRAWAWPSRAKCLIEHSARQVIFDSLWFRPTSPPKIVKSVWPLQPTTESLRCWAIFLSFFLFLFFFPFFFFKQWDSERRLKSICWVCHLVFAVELQKV